MLAIQLPSSVPAGIVQYKRIMREVLPPIPQLRFLDQNARSEHDAVRRTGVGHTVSATRAGDTATIYHGLRTPPLEPHDMNVNPLLAPSYGPLHYKGVPVVAPNTASHQHSLSSVGNARYTSKVPPLPESYKPTHRSQSSISRSENDENREHTHRGRNNDGTDIAHYLQIPPSINDSKGSLAEFAAQITCLFWFESSITLQLVEESKTTFSPLEPLVSEAMPTSGFRKWVTTVLSTTQVTQNVILLALMFIYRLKRLNPGVKGKLGSEFRLLTVALMLGNKFLDDNTYTNKTWAEVSGISVQEIHIMEVEFLSNMRYTLYVSDKEWKEWHVKLGRFWHHFDRASKKPLEPVLRNRSLHSSSVSTSLDLPSPPASTNTSPPYPTHNSFSHPALPHPLSVPPYLPPSIPSPTSLLPDTDPRSSGRKRSHDEQPSEPPAKRPLSSFPPSGTSSTTLTPSTARGITPAIPRLPMPNLSVPTNSHHNGGYHGSPAQLPLPASRSSSESFPTPVRWPQNGTLPALPQPAPFNVPPQANFSGPSEWHSRHSSYGPSSATPSPTSYQFPQSQHTPTHLSPAEYPAIRHSPYKPVRSVNTLLVPPPSASMHNPPQGLGNDQMRYQQLGKPLSERKTGIPPFMHQDSWAQPPPVPYNLPQPKFC